MRELREGDYYESYAERDRKGKGNSLTWGEIYLQDLATWKYIAKKEIKKIKEKKV